MGTLQQELTKLQSLDSLRFDDDPAPQNQTNTSSVSELHEEKTKRQLYWEWLRDHPASTAREIADAFNLPQPYMSTIISKLHERGLVARVERGGSFYYHTIVAEYPVYTKEQRVAVMVAGRKARKKGLPYRSKRVKAAEKSVEPVVSLEERKAQLRGFTTPTPMGVENILNGLNIIQARDLYDRLKTIFGGQA